MAINDPLCEALRTAASRLPGTDRRQFMGAIVNALDVGAQRWAENTLGWNRGTVRKGQHEVDGVQPCRDNFHLRGRKPIKHRLPGLRADIKTIAESYVQQDPTFRTTRLYRRVTAETIHKNLVELPDYTYEILPSVRTICSILNDLGFLSRKVAKSKPVKKIKQTDAIFDELHRVNDEADQSPGVSSNLLVSSTIQSRNSSGSKTTASAPKERTHRRTSHQPEVLSSRTMDPSSCSMIF